MLISLGVVDDHQLFVKSLSALINTFPGLEVIVDAVNGTDLLRKLETGASLPDIILLDVSIPSMDGIGTARIIAENTRL